MKKKKIVTIGGGTGSFTLLTGLKNYPFELTAIVTMTDDGGSTGILRDELGVLPPGDVRQCLVALSDSSEMLRKIMNYRFEEGSLKGHNFGNLFLSALEKINGSFDKGIKQAHDILNIKGLVVPVTKKNTNVIMELQDKTVLIGEKQISNNDKLEKVGIKKHYLKPEARANSQAIKKILEADAIIIGPGNHYCSIVPNLLVEGVSKAIRQTKAKVFYCANLVNKKGHTGSFSVDDYVKSINSYIGDERVDYVLYNTKKPHPRLIEKYKNAQELLVIYDNEEVDQRKYKVIAADLISQKKFTYSKSDKLAANRAFIRHDGDKIAKVISIILNFSNHKKILKQLT